MTKTQLEKYQSRYAGIKKSTPTNAEETSQEQSFMQQFNQYLKNLPDNVKISNKELLRDLFREYGENAYEEYKKRQENQQQDKTPRKLSVTFLSDSNVTDDKENKEDNKPKEQKNENKTDNTDTKPTNWLDGYEKSFTKWVKNNTFKKDGKPKRTIQSNKSENTLDIDITPVNPSPTRPDQGVKYHIEKGENTDDVAVTVTNKNPKKTLNYDYVYALVKSAKENGIDEIEFKDIKDSKFADMLVVASLQFDMKMTNAPEYQVDETARYIPEKLKEKISKYNKDKQPRPQTETNKKKHQPYNKQQRNRD